MKIVFHEAFYQSDYADDGASVPGRCESIMHALTQDGNFEVILPQAAKEEDILLAHSKEYVEGAKTNAKLFEMATLAVGAAVLAGNIGCEGTPSFACLRPPGHHASINSTWGYCVFSNMAIALLRLKSTKLINSAFILDFDAHTGDGTKSVLSNWKECRILNPYAETGALYIDEIKNCIANIEHVDIVAICAGFDSYEKDLGRKLSTFEFYEIGVLMKKFSNRVAGGKRFAILEGGYYLPDLGKNVLAFCQGFQ